MRLVTTILMYISVTFAALCLWWGFMQPDNWHHWLNAGTFIANAFTMSIIRKWP